MIATMKDADKIINIEPKKELTQFPSRIEVDRQFLELSEKMSGYLEMVNGLRLETNAFIDNYNKNVRAVNESLSEFATAILSLKKEFEEWKKK